MRLIIAGSRDIDPDSAAAWIDEILDPREVSMVICGMAAGVDMLGWHWASEYGIDILEMPAEWKQFGKQAGYIRNQAMAFEADSLLAIWDGKSKGTRHMINIALDKGLDVTVKVIR